MGICHAKGISPEEQARDAEIAAKLARDRDEEGEIIKILLLGAWVDASVTPFVTWIPSASGASSAASSFDFLVTGAGESGKSTLLKQMRELYGKRITEDEHKRMRGIVHGNIVAAIAAVLNYCDNNDYVLESLVRTFSHKGTVSGPSRGEDRATRSPFRMAGLGFVCCAGGGE